MKKKKKRNVLNHNSVCVVDEVEKRDMLIRMNVFRFWELKRRRECVVCCG
jgi:hypothetical protein